jgi:hypothetical protein
MEKLQTLRDNLCEELDKVARKPDITTGDLEIIDKLTHSIKNLDKVMLGNEMIKEYGYSFANEYSGDYSGARNNRGRRGRDGDGDGRYSEERGRNNYDGRSYERSYDNRSYDNRSYDYSGHDEQSIERFKHMMQDAIHEL